MMRAAPGNPFETDRKLPPEIEHNIRPSTAWTGRCCVQYVNYVGGVLHGDFGPSLKYRDKSVLDIIAQNYQVSLTIGLAAFAIMVIVGVTLGVIAALRQNGPADYTVMVDRHRRHLYSQLRHRAAAAAGVRQPAGLAADRRVGTAGRFPTW